VGVMGMVIAATVPCMSTVFLVTVLFVLVMGVTRFVLH
jgi:hypothetical protein